MLPERLALVLGGGGLKGFAHIGLLRAFEERGIRPALVAGTSIGALIAAAYASGMPVDEMERRALALTKKDLFRIDHLHMVTKRMLSPSLYLGRPARRARARHRAAGDVPARSRSRCSSTRSTSSAARR